MVGYSTKSGSGFGSISVSQDAIGDAVAGRRRKNADGTYSDNSPKLDLEVGGANFRWHWSSPVFMPWGGPVLPSSDGFVIKEILYSQSGMYNRFNCVGYILTGQMRDNNPGDRVFSALSREGRTAG